MGEIWLPIKMQLWAIGLGVVPFSKCLGMYMQK